MPRTFREALIAATTKPGPSVREVAEGAGVSYEQLKKVVQREGASTNVEDARKIAAFLGFTLDEFLEDQDAPTQAEAIALYRSLSPEERQLLKDLAKARAAQAREEEK